MLREYIISEAIHALNIPTTRSLAVVKTGEAVMRETPLIGAILTRVAESHIRVGTFQYAVTSEDKSNLKTLFDYTVNRHYPNIKDSKTPALDLLKTVIEKQTKLVVDRIHYCGAYWYSGFHEDGVRSALDVCKRFGLGL